MELECFTGSMLLLTPNHSLEICGGPETDLYHKKGCVKTISGGQIKKQSRKSIWSSPTLVQVIKYQEYFTLVRLVNQHLNMVRSIHAYIIYTKFSGRPADHISKHVLNCKQIQ